MKICKNCGIENLDSANFCVECGTNLNEEVTAIEKKSNVGMILGIIACSLFIVLIELNTFTWELVREIVLHESIGHLCSFLYAIPIIVVSAIGLSKSIKSKSLPGLIMNPIALGISVLIASGTFNDFILALF